MNVVADLGLVAVHGPVAGLQTLADEVFGVGHEAPIEAEGPADVMHHGAALRQLLGLGQAADGVDVERAHAVVGRVHIDRRLVVKALQVRPGLRQVDDLDRCARPLLRGLNGGMRAGARLLVVDHAALDHAARLAGAEADDVEGAPAREFTHEDGHLGGADFDGTDESGLRNHVSV
jgi:hypothetical protein